MANVQYYDVILSPVVTEKSMNAMAEKKYTFLVHTDANKTMIKEAVEKMFEGTKVKSVNTMNLEGKTKSFAKVMANLNVEGKALVVLNENDQNVVLSARNIATVKTALTNTINTYDIVNAKTLVLTQDAVKTIEEVYA